MARQLHLTHDLAVRWIDRCQRPAPEADKQSFGRSIVTNIIGIVTERDRLRRTVLDCIDQLHALAVAVCDGDDFRIGNNGDALRLPKSRQALDVTPVPDIEHLHCVVAKGSDEQPLGRCIDGQVVNATFEFRKLD